MPDKVVRRSKIAEGLALLAVAVALITSATVYGVNNRAIDKINDARAKVAYASCKSSNQRNTNANAYIRSLVAVEHKRNVKKFKNNPAALKAADAKVAEGVARYAILFQALTPKRDCTKYIKTYFHRTITGDPEPN